MVLISYQDRDGILELYEGVKEASCGRQVCSVAILVAHEVDAISSCRMLTNLFKLDNIAYIIRSVANYGQIKYCLDEIMTSEIKTVFLINCGAVKYFFIY